MADLLRSAQSSRDCCPLECWNQTSLESKVVQSCWPGFFFFPRMHSVICGWQNIFLVMKVSGVCVCVDVATVLCLALWVQGTSVFV